MEIGQQLRHLNQPHTTIRAIGQMLQRDWDVTITHVYRESKRAADNLAKYVARLPFGMHIFCFPLDATGLAIPRLIHI